MALKRIGTVDERGTLQPKDAFLPNLEAVESRIKERKTENLGGQLKEFLTSSIKASQLPAPFNILATLPGGVKAGGELFKRAEAGIANLGLNIQRAPADEPINTAVDDFLSGIKGERLGEFGDLVRTTGVGGKFNEPIAKATGFLAATGLANLATGDMIRSGARKMENSISRSLKRGKVKNIRRSTRFFKDQADQFSEGIDEAYTGMRSEYRGVFSKIKQNIISGDDAVDLQDIVTRQPPSVINRIKKLSELRGGAQGGATKVNKFRTVLEPNINSAKNIQKQIGREIPRKVWNGLEQATPEQVTMMDDYFKLGDIIAKNAGVEKGALLRINAKFSELHKLNQRITPVLKNVRGTTKTGIRNIRSESMQGDLAELERFNKRFFKDGKEILKEIDRFNRNQKIKRGVTLGLAGVGGAVLLDQFVRRPIVKGLREAGGGGGSSRQE